MLLQGTASKAEVVQLKTKGFLLTLMNKVLPQAVKQRTWPILKEGLHPSTVILQQETPFWTALHHFKGREKSQYIVD